MSAAEKRAAFSLSLVFFLRMLPLFMLLPVLTLAHEQYSHATPQLLGIALGIYGLTQAILQIPFGLFSDRFGRKPVIAAGLMIFIIGSLIAALSDSIYGLLLGRALQGAGAIAAAIMALAADLSSEHSRTKVMASIGISIGVAFSLAFISGPLLYARFGLDGVFYLGAMLGVAAIIILFVMVPTPINQHNHRETKINFGDLKTVFSHPYLSRLDCSIFISHLVLMANFVVIPIALRDDAHLPALSHGYLYLSVFFASLLIMVPFIIFGERLKKITLFFKSSLFLILFSQLGLALFHHSVGSIAVFLVLFFGAFNYLEALLPAEVSKASDAVKKGTALGVYSSSQFAGVFTGGLLGGLFYEKYGIASVHSLCFVLVLLWLVLISRPVQKQNVKKPNG